MDKSAKIILLAVGGLVVSHLLFNIFGSNRLLKDALKKLDSSEIKLDSATNLISSSQSEIGDMKLKVDSLNVFIKDAQARAEKIDLEKRLNEKQSKAERDTIQKRLDDLKLSLPDPGEDVYKIQTVQLKKTPRK